VLLAAESPNGNNVADKIWALEEDYISAFKNADHSRILDFYHREFLGWPGSQDRPAGRSEAETFLEEQYARPLCGSFEIDRAGIRVLGDVVITHYVLNLSTLGANGVEQKQATRITHTWLKEDGRWWIAGGMSSR
jgi:uncharacterized protein (TIGR02246 family)